MVKILYAALRHDPLNPNLASGVDFNFYTAFGRHDFDIRIVGPFCKPPVLGERIIKKLYSRMTGKKYLKWDASTAWRASRAVNSAAREYQPDIVFSLFPPLLAAYNGTVPCIFNTDTTFQGWQEGGANFGELALKFLVWQERRAVHKSALVITFSEWCKHELVYRHAINPDKVVVLPMPAALPLYVVPPPEVVLQDRRLDLPLRLLVVGRDYQRKGIDVGLEIMRQLNAQGIPTQLTVCGASGEQGENVQFVGPFRKSVPTELEQYVNLYRQAHFLIHPARFDPSPIVPAEAAAFGVPTITNDTGGIATSCAHDVSGYVLPKGSPAGEYVRVVQHYLAHPEQYTALCRTARERYDREQNWLTAGQQVASIIQNVVAEDITTRVRK